MRAVMLSMLALLAIVGCQETQLRDKTTLLATTAPDVFEQQVLDNIALIAAKRDAMPYFLIPSQGTAQIARTLQAQYTPGWDFIPALGHYVFDKQGAQLQGTNQNQETWQTLPVSDPDKLLLMRTALHRAFGFDDEYNATLKLFYSQNSIWAHYDGMIETGWFSIGTKKMVPKKACFVGHYCDTYVWIVNNDGEPLAKLTLAILDILTFQATNTSNGLATLPAPTKAYTLSLPSKISDQLDKDTIDKLKNLPLAYDKEKLKTAIDNIINNSKPLPNFSSRGDLKSSLFEAIQSKDLPPDHNVYQSAAPILSPRITPGVLAPPPASSPVP